MASNSSNNVESDKNLKENKDPSGDKSQPNDSDIIYFDCKICQNTFTTCKGQENTDPNSVPDICKNCKAKQKFQDAVSPSSGSSAPTHSVQIHTPTAALQPAGLDDGTNLSPLTSYNGDVGSGSSITSGPPPPSSPFIIGESHIHAVSAKAPKVGSSNIGVMHLYNSNGVYDSELESLIKLSNEKRIDKFYAGVDVIYKPGNRKVCSCVPLLCPAKVYYSVADETELRCEVIVGIIYDSHNSAVPVVAIYDAFKQFKNFSKGRHVIHTYFSRFQPSSIEHDFTADELNRLSQELFSYLNIKSAFQEMEDELDEYKSMNVEKDKKIKELIDLSNTQASKQTEAVKRLAEENKSLKAEIAALKKQVIAQPKAPRSDDDEASSSAGAKKKSQKAAGRPKKETVVKKEKVSSASEDDDEMVNNARAAANSSGRKRVPRQSSKYDDFNDEEDEANYATTTTPIISTRRPPASVISMQQQSQQYDEPHLQKRTKYQSPSLLHQPPQYQTQQKQQPPQYKSQQQQPPPPQYLPQYQSQQQQQPPSYEPQGQQQQQPPYYQPRRQQQPPPQYQSHQYPPAHQQQPIYEPPQYQAPMDDEYDSQIPPAAYQPPYQTQYKPLPQQRRPEYQSQHPLTQQLPTYPQLQYQPPEYPSHHQPRHTMAPRPTARDPFYG